MTKTVYGFDPATRRYIGPVVLDDTDLSPLEPGVYLIPGDCVEDAPPQGFPGQTVSRSEGGWVLDAMPVAQIDAATGEVLAIEDRTVLTADTSERLYRLAGPAVAPGDLWNGALGSFEPPPTSIDVLLAGKLQAIAIARSAAQQSMLVQGVVYDTSDTAATRISTAIGARTDAQALGLEAPDAVATWKVGPGAYLDLSLTGMKQLRLQGVAHVQACFDVERVKATEAIAAHANGDREALLADDAADGFPA